MAGFSDGSFETPVLPPGVVLQDFTTGEAIGPWTVTSGTVDLVGSSYFQPAQGTQSLDLNGHSPGAVSQTFTTTPGTTYVVTYALAGNPVCATPTVRTGKVLIDGQDFQDFSFDITGKTTTNMGYVARQVSFVAVNTSTTLTFASTTPNTECGPVIDNVTVCGQPAVPCGP
ncbi:choice-of-anchor C family protein [Streptantibioticus ferralitis]|uniref:Choice-of-anchor C family protein n=1 Tax=Streptantibioticus ferralitis TaxID=236510 RepID=A0ABT5Z0S2_9ACTN|nr:choice-of-anchor C family protein [Streptantibioticus ferralitis]MDF2257434.1 choice-of-anchor C family protein [Streptantibioticus ferralitis]